MRNVTVTDSGQDERKKTKESRFVAHAAKFAAEEAAYICRNFGLDVEGIRAKAQETFEFEKG